MKNLKFDCDCDTVLAMEELGVGVEEILQYAHATVPTRCLFRLFDGIREIMTDRRDPGEDFASAA